MMFQSRNNKMFRDLVLKLYPKWPDFDSTVVARWRKTSKVPCETQERKRSKIFEGYKELDVGGNSSRYYSVQVEWTVVILTEEDGVEGEDFLSITSLTQVVYEVQSIPVMGLVQSFQRNGAVL